MAVQCFLLVPTPMVKQFLRRYALDPAHRPDLCPVHGGSHHAMALLQTVEKHHNAAPEHWPHEDERWPKVCGCGYAFKDTDNWQLFDERVWQRQDNGEQMTLPEAPVGAMWNAYWHNDFWHGDDGMSIMVKVPGGCEWLVDGPANNCTMKGDRNHHCWVRHGVPPNITVDKNGPTCEAGAGSIQTKNWHGFLRNGLLVE